MNPKGHLTALLLLGLSAVAVQSNLGAAATGRGAKLIHEDTLPSFSLLDFGYSEAELTAAQANGLAFTDLPAIGSGVQLLEGNRFLCVTDRGPNADRADGNKIFPLPQFTPTIVWFRSSGGLIVPEAILPIVNDQGNGVTGIPSSSTISDTVPYISATATTPLPYNPDGMDVEDIHTLPGGGYILVEEYGPSVFIVGADGHMRVRYIPAGRTLPGAHYPVQSTLPGVFGQRRGNRGFEGLAVSPDGRTAYTMTQSPMGSTSASSPYRESSVIRVLRLDISDPMNLHVTAEYLFKELPASDFPAGNAQRDLKISAAAWVSPERLIVTLGTDKAGSAGGHKVVLIDMTRATDVLHLPDASTVPLVYEKTSTDFAALGITLAETTVVADLLHDLPQIAERKLEGMTIRNANEIIISSDNDFGIGDVPGAQTKLYTIRLPAPLQ